MTCFCHAEPRIYDFKSRLEHTLAVKEAFRFEIYVHEPRVYCCCCWCNIAIKVFFPFSNEFSDITNWNDLCIFDEQKSIVAPSSLHSNCHWFVRVVFTSLSNRNKNSSLNYRWIPVKKRQTDSKTATMLNQNEIEANQYMRPLEIFRQIMHFDGINIFRLVIKPHKILIQSASYTRMGVQTIVKLS